MIRSTHIVGRFNGDPTDGFGVAHTSWNGEQKLAAAMIDEAITDLRKQFVPALTGTDRSAQYKYRTARDWLFAVPTRRTARGGGPVLPFELCCAALRLNLSYIRRKLDGYWVAELPALRVSTRERGVVTKRVRNRQRGNRWTKLAG